MYMVSLLYTTSLFYLNAGATFSDNVRVVLLSVGIALLLFCAYRGLVIFQGSGILLSHKIEMLYGIATTHFPDNPPLKNWNFITLPRPAEEIRWDSSNDGGAYDVLGDQNLSLENAETMRAVSSAIIPQSSIPRPVPVPTRPILSHLAPRKRPDCQDPPLV